MHLMYKSLDRLKSEIRLVRVGTDANANISATLLTTALSATTEPFTALSYGYHDPPVRDNIGFNGDLWPPT